jgi:hypothetical protein
MIKDAQRAGLRTPTPTNSERGVVNKEKEEDTFFPGKSRRKESSS